MFRTEGVAGIVFVSLYTVNLGVLIYGYATRRIVFRSVFTLLLFHVCLRLAAQAIYIAIAARPTFSLGLLIAYFVLAIEGYFSLVLVSYRLLVHHQQQTYPVSGSWLEARARTGDTFGRRLKHAFTARDETGHRDPWVMTWIHWTLIAANAIIVSGGSIGLSPSTGDATARLNRTNAMRSAGQAVFLVLNILLGVFLVLSRRQDLRPDGALPRGWTRALRVPADHGQADAAAGSDPLRQAGKVHPTLLMLFAAWPPLIVRGIFGLLQTQVAPINYADQRAYGSGGGFSSTFVACESTLAVLPEWTACCLLCVVMFTRDQWIEIKAREDGAGGHGDAGLKADDSRLSEVPLRSKVRGGSAA